MTPLRCGASRSCKFDRKTLPITSRLREASRPRWPQLVMPPQREPRRRTETACGNCALSLSETWKCEARSCKFPRSRGETRFSRCLCGVETKQTAAAKEAKSPRLWRRSFSGARKGPSSAPRAGTVPFKHPEQPGTHPKPCRHGDAPGGEPLRDAWATPWGI